MKECSALKRQVDVEKIEAKYYKSELTKEKHFAKMPLTSAFEKVKEMRELLQCPITAAVMSEPVVCSDGHTYEKAAIQEWMTTKGTSPMTRDKLSHELYTNVLVKKIQASLYSGTSGVVV